MVDFSQNLSPLMQRVGILNFKALSRAANVSERQILRLRRGEVQQMRIDVLLKLSQVLGISLTELVVNFSDLELEQSVVPSQELLKEITNLKAEYARLQLQLENQQQRLEKEFQQSSLQLLESLLLQFPTAAHKARENPQLPFVNIIPLVQKPLEKLLQHWGVEAIATVGEELAYDPQLHQILDGNAQAGEKVKVRYLGYKQGDKLLYRAKVSRV